MEIKDLVEQLNTASTEIKNAQDKMQTEIKANGEAAAETKAAFDKANGQMDELKNQFAKVDEKLIALEKASKRHSAAAGPERKSLGQAFVEGVDLNEAYAQKRASVDFQRKDISNLAASAGALVRPDRDTTVYRNPSRPMRIRDLIPSLPTTSNAVEVMRQNVFTNNAGPQQPGTPNANIGGGEFVAKPQSNITWSLETYPVRTIAHFVPASRQVLQDANQLQSLIDLELTYGLDLQIDFQLLQGTGTNQSVTGLLVDADVSSVGELATGTAAADVPAAMIDHIRAAVTECQKNEYYNINGLVLNPEDWQVLETAKATDGHYLLVAFAATSSETSTVWRIPVIVTNAMPATEFLLGDWTMGAKIYEREDVSVRVSESHEDFFVKNAVAILGEERYAFAVTLPKAFCKGSFEVASA